MTVKGVTMERWELVSQNGDKSTDGNLLVANIAAVFFGNTTAHQFSGSPTQAKALESAMLASQAFHAEVNNPNPSLANISSALKNKNQASNTFQAALGVHWPL